MKTIRDHLFAKLLLSYVAVIAMGAIVLVAAALLMTPRVYQRHMDIGGALIQTTPGQPNIMRNMMTERNRSVSNFRAGLLDAIGWSLLVSGVAAFGISIFFSRQILRPLDKLNEITRQIANGDYGHRLQVEGGDEFARLAANVNAMSDKLQNVEETRIRMIGDISHELRTPLTILGGYVEGMADGVVAPSRDNLDLMGRETARLTRLVGELQELSRVESGDSTFHKSPIGLVSLVMEVCRQLQPLFVDKQVVLDTQPLATQSELVVSANTDKLTQIFTNLLANALQYSPAGSRVLVRVIEQDKMAIVDIIDQGVGLQQDDVSKVFERFYRVDRSRARNGSGSGIGLSIARALARQHGGEISASSAGLGKGSTFRVSLPIGSE